MKTLAIIALIGGGILWYVSHRTETTFAGAKLAREEGGRSILKPDAEPVAVKIVGSFVDTGEDGASIVIRGRAEDCDSSTPGCFQDEVLMMVTHPDQEQVRVRPPFYRGTHYYLGAGAIRNDDNGKSQVIQHFGSLLDAKRAAR